LKEGGLFFCYFSLLKSAMKRLFVLLFCLSAACSEKAATESAADKPLTKNAQGRAEGVQKSYYETGKIKNEVTYVDGRRDGPARQYYANGQAESEITYKNNLKDGPSRWYYEDGILYQEVPFRAGKKHGVEKKYHNTGKIMAELFWAHGEPLPGLKEYDFNGKALRQPYIAVDGDRKLEIKLSNGDEKVTFFIGKLADGQPMAGAGLEALPVNKGIATYTLKAGQKSLDLVALRKTSMKNPQILTHTYELP